MTTGKKIENKSTSAMQVLRPEDFSDVIASDLASKEFPRVSFATWVRVLMQNWRQGTVGCKDRGDLTSRSNKKPFKQKGTGRARAGSARSPLWRGGGVIFGPQPRVRVLKMAKQQKALVLRHGFYQYLSQGKIFGIEEALSDHKPSTAKAYSLLKNAGLENSKVALFVSQHDLITCLSFANIPTVHVLFFDQPNAVDLSKNKNWLFFKKDLDMFKEMVSKWN